jgi:hypothetical protein
LKAEHESHRRYWGSLLASATCFVIHLVGVHQALFGLGLRERCVRSFVRGRLNHHVCVQIDET